MTIELLDWLLLRLAAMAGIVIGARYLAIGFRFLARVCWSAAAAVDAIGPAWRSAWRSSPERAHLREVA